MGELVIALVGVGPRGLSVLERLLVRLAGLDRAVTVWAFDAVGHGDGRVWRAGQPAWFGANTTAGESTVRSPDGLLPEERFGSLAVWGGLDPAECPPRRLYGQYLAAAFAALCASAPPRVGVRPVVAEVTRIVRAADGLRVDAGGTAYRVDKAVLTTGHADVETTREQLTLARHAERWSGAVYVPPGLAVEMPLDVLPPGAAVAVRGLGLTFYDVLRAVTLGRGGRFTGGSGGLRYLPSGNEPRLLAMSRGGLPFLARPSVPAFPAPAVPLRVITEERLAGLRADAAAATGTPQLDFARLVEPLIQYEADLACMTGAARPLGTLARPFAGRRFATPDAYRARLAALLRADAGRARAGCAGGVLKAATEMLRAIRPLLPAIVDFGGLLPDSHRDFLGRFAPESFVLSAGPPAAHVEQRGPAVTRSPYRVLDARGRPDPDIHALGVATGDTRWFTEVGTGRPGRDSPFRRDADAVAAALLGQEERGQDGVSAR
ncbi:FAD/NAD(P)-binding protein [Actinomadura sp. ATCC 39365]